ncbi:MAG: glycosyltransferase [Caulobacteraceae bacterium]
MAAALSVVICTHNPRKTYLQRVMDALECQSLDRKMWDIILVDNCSDNLMETRSDFQWPDNLRHVLASELGLSFARARGIREATAPVVVFVDDDNILDPTYLEIALNISREWPILGVWGGSIEPEFESPPPREVEPYLSMLALRTVERATWSNVSGSIAATPWGAGLCLRTSLGLAYCDHLSTSNVQITDRKGRDLVSGGDVELSYFACHTGLGMGVFPQLRVTHLIPKERVQAPYLLRLRTGIGTSDQLLAHKWLGRSPRSFRSPANLLRVGKELATRTGLDRRMYLADLKSTRDAMRIIRNSRTMNGDAIQAL